MTYVILFFYRQLGQAVIIICLFDSPELSVIFTVVLCLIWNIILIVIWPFAEPIDNIIALINEISVLINVYLLMCLTGQFVAHEARSLLGTTIITYTCANFFTTIVITAFGLRKPIMLHFKRWQAKKAHKKRLELFRGKRMKEIEDRKAVLAEATSAQV